MGKEKTMFSKDYEPIQVDNQFHIGLDNPQANAMLWKRMNNYSNFDAIAEPDENDKGYFSFYDFTPDDSIFEIVDKECKKVGDLFGLEIFVEDVEAITGEGYLRDNGVLPVHYTITSKPKPNLYLETGKKIKKELDRLADEFYAEFGFATLNEDEMAECLGRWVEINLPKPTKLGDLDALAKLKEQMNKSK